MVAMAALPFDLQKDFAPITLISGLRTNVIVPQGSFRPADSGRRRLPCVPKEANPRTAILQDVGSHSPPEVLPVELTKAENGRGIDHCCPISPPA